MKFINVSVFLQIFQNLISQKFSQGTSSATQLSALKKLPVREKQLLPGRVRPPPSLSPAIATWQTVMAGDAEWGKSPGKLQSLGARVEGGTSELRSRD